MNHIILNISIHPLEPFRDILAAELFEIGFEGTMETDYGIQAFITEPHLDRNALKEVLSNEIFKEVSIKILDETIEKERNWNQEWEDRFEPVLVDKRCLVRAPFNHVQGNFEFELVIQPKMSFGTGHHSTTSLMLGYLLDMEMPEHILDMGSGTGVLAIFCKKQGAKNVLAIDIDEWAFENTQENMRLNNVKGIEIRHGDATQLKKDDCFELVLANINRNVLLEDMGVYAQHLTKGGTLLLSGFYTEDLSMIKDCALNFGLTFEEHHVEKNWVAARFLKNG